MKGDIIFQIFHAQKTPSEDYQFLHSQLLDMSPRMNPSMKYSLTAITVPNQCDDRMIRVIRAKALE